MADNARDYHKPLRRPAEHFDRQFAAQDPAEVSRVAHATAEALLSRLRAAPDDTTVQRLLTYTDEHGLDTVAELWSRSPAKSLPGALWRLHLLHVMIHDDGRTTALLYERGRSILRSADDVVAGAPTPAGPEELSALIDEIFRGVFRGDFAIALERAASFCRIEVAGATDMADDYDQIDSDRATNFTARGVRLAAFADDLSSCAALWRRERLT